MAALRAIILALFTLFGLASPALAADSDDGLVITVFWGAGCPHCATEFEFLEELSGEFPTIQLTAYEVRYDQANRELFTETMEGFGLEPRAVPTTVIGDRVWVGFSDAVAAEIRQVVVSHASAETTQPASPQTIELPLLGEVEPGEVPLVVSTALIALVDGVNPCSLWVLSILLALVLRSGSRRRVVAIGGTFLLITALLYGLYIAGMYGVLTYLTNESWVRVAMALVALGFGVVSLKEYFTFGEGMSLGIASSKKPGLYQKMRSVSVEARTLPMALAGTALLAVGVSVLETPCTAGYPLLWTNLLAEQQVGLAGAAPLFLLYMTIFLADELVILGAAVVTMRATKIEERAGRVMRLVGGAVMIALAGALIFAPDAMTTIVGSLAVFGVGGVLVLVVLVVDRIRTRDLQKKLVRGR